MGRFGLEIAMYLIFIKFGTQNKSNMLIMNILIGIDDLDWKLKICFQSWNVFQFLWNLALRAKSSIQIMNIVLGTDYLDQNYRFGQIWSQNWNVRNVYEFWHSELIEYIHFYKLFGIQKWTQNSRIGQIWSHISNIILFLWSLVFRAYPKFRSHNRST